MLKLESHINSDAFEYLASDVDFTCLKTLVLRGVPMDSSLPAAKSFLKNLRPLSSLTIKDWHEKFVAEDILHPHGPNLIELRQEDDFEGLIYAITHRDLSKIAQSCSSLQYLTLALDRIEGNAQEVARYRTLGSLPKLRCVSLMFQLWVPWEFIYERDDGNSTYDPCLDEFDQQIPGVSEFTQPSNSLIRLRLINCALDPALGRAIFRAISAGKPESSVPLEKLSIQMPNVEYLGDFDETPSPLEWVLPYLSRPLQVMRNVRDDCRDELLVEQKEPDPDVYLPSELPEWLQAIWRRVWPEKMADEWWNDWHSLPLASFDD